MTDPIGRNEVVTNYNHNYNKRDRNPFKYARSEYLGLRVLSTMGTRGFFLARDGSLKMKDTGGGRFGPPIHNLPHMERRATQDKTFQKHNFLSTHFNYTIPS